MDRSDLHSWDLSPAEARAVQARLQGMVDTSPPLPEFHTLAAADCSFDRFGTEIHAAVVFFERDGDSFREVETVGATAAMTFPYVPGLLSFREGPVILEAFAKLRRKPDVVLCDGQGIAHPRRLGIASHMGLWLQIPTVGCAKSLLCGSYDEPGPIRGDRSPLVDHGELVGTVLRSKARVKPLFVSPGHLCDFEGAVRVVMETSGQYRLPFPARLAHEAVNAIRRKAKSGD